MAMTVACTLHIRSNVYAELPSGFLRPRKKAKFVFVDNLSPEMLERRGRVRRRLGLDDVAIPRYHWRLSSDGLVSGDDLHKHLQWLLGHIQSEHAINDLLGASFAYWFAASWTGNGTGGGPLISLASAELLVRHRAEMGVAFYLET